MYIYQRPEWPYFTWQPVQLQPLLGLLGPRRSGKLMSDLLVRELFI